MQKPNTNQLRLKAQYYYGNHELRTIVLYLCDYIDQRNKNIASVVQEEVYRANGNSKVTVQQLRDFIFSQHERDSLRTDILDFIDNGPKKMTASEVIQQVFDESQAQDWEVVFYKMRDCLDDLDLYRDRS